MTTIYFLITLIALVAAAIGILFAFRATGHFEYLGGRGKNTIPPLPKEVLLHKLLNLNAPSLPWQIRQGENTDLLAEWKIADATWYGIFSKNRLKTAYRAYLLFDESRHAVRQYEEFGSVTWLAGTSGVIPMVHYTKRFFGGRILFKKSYGVGYGFKTPHPASAGKVYSYHFDIDEIRIPIVTAVENAGWEWVPVTGRRNATFS